MHRRELEVIHGLDEAELQKMDLFERNKLKYYSGKADAASQKKWTEQLFQKFLISLNFKKLVKVKYNKEEILDFFKPKTDRDISMIKMMKNMDCQPRVSVYEIKQPEEEQTLIKKLDGQIIAGKHSYELLNKLVDSYQNEDLKIKNRMMEKLRKIFMA